MNFIRHTFNNFYLNNIIYYRDYNALKRYILSHIDFKYTFTSDYYQTNISNYLYIQSYVIKFEKYVLKMNLNQSLIFKISLNLFDHNNDVRNYYNWKCSICNVNCINDKDILDIHVINFNKGRYKYIIGKNNLKVCCRLCHYNIDPKNHWNLNINKDVCQRINNLRTSEKHM